MFIQEYSSKACLESLSWNILIVLLHSIESEKAAFFEVGDHTYLQVFAKALTLRNYEQLWSCSLAQVLSSRINRLAILTASLVKVYWSFQIFTVNVSHGQELWTLKTLKKIISEHSVKQVWPQCPLVVSVQRFPEAWTLGRIFECKLFWKEKKNTI